LIISAEASIKDCLSVVDKMHTRSFFCIGLFSGRKEDEHQFDTAMKMTLKP
jgi:hypothetical protein